MTLTEMSAEYRQSGELLRARLAELNTKLENGKMCEMERLRLRRKTSMLEGMLRDTVAISNYLENYYGGRINERKEAQYVC